MDRSKDAGPFATALRAQFRFLLFESIRDEIAKAPRAVLALGLVATWLAGVGRYWDAPVAEWWQLAGLGSVAYAFVLAAILWAVTWPVAPRRQTYRAWLTFVVLTSAPAILYAVPVERFLSIDGARAANVWFLAIVALWRVALLVRHLGAVVGFGAWGALVTTFLPINLVIVALTMLNLEGATFELMGGLEREPTAADRRYEFLVLLTALSTLTLPLLLIAYGVLVLGRSERVRSERAAVPGEPVEASDAPDRSA